MTKAELAGAIAERRGISQAEAVAVVEALIDSIKEELAAGGSVAIAGFGTFAVSNRAARQGRNPSTGETINITSSKAAKFSAAASLKSRLNPEAPAISGSAGNIGRPRSGPTVAPRKAGGGKSKAKRVHSVGLPQPSSPPQPPSSLTPAADSPDPAPRPRFLIAQGPQVVSVAKTFSVLVRIGLTGPGTELHPVVVPRRGLSVLVVAYAPGLEIDEARQTLHVPYDRDSDPVRFDLKAQQSGIYQVAISAWNGASPLGEMHIEVTAEPQAASRSDREVHLDLSTDLSNEEGSVGLVIRFDPKHRKYRFEFHDVDNPQEITCELTYDPQGTLGPLLANLDTLAKDKANYSHDQTRDFLINAGIRLWNGLVPPDLQAQFWERQSRIKRLTIFTEHDQVPWELLYPMDRNHDCGFLVEHFPVMRGIFNRSPSRTLRFSPARFVLPKGSPSAAEGEIDAIRKLLGVRRTPATVIETLTPLTKLIDSGRFGLLHFACHNRLASATGGGSVITLDARAFTPMSLEKARARKSLERSSPFVFINACRSATSTPCYNQLDDWAAAFLGAGAAAFAGSLWNIRDDTAREFAEALYCDLKQGEALGQAVLNARKAAANASKDPTWLAYTVYGDPRATLTP
jgi:nucleoid DNA-binding protein